MSVQAHRGPVAVARLIWAARSEASRLHRLAVEAARHEAHVLQQIEQADDRVYRCPGCGDWRYDTEHRTRPGDRRTCSACGTRRPATAQRSVA